MLLIFNFFVFVTAGVNAARDAGRFLLATRAQIRLVKESAEQHEVAEIHARRKLNVEHGDMTRLVGFKVRVRPVIDEAPDHHLGDL